MFHIIASPVLFVVDKLVKLCMWPVDLIIGFCDNPHNYNIEWKASTKTKIAQGLYKYANSKYASHTIKCLLLDSQIVLRYMQKNDLWTVGVCNVKIFVCPITEKSYTCNRLFRKPFLNLYCQYHYELRRDEWESYHMPIYIELDLMKISAITEHKQRIVYATKYNYQSDHGHQHRINILIHKYQNDCSIDSKGYIKFSQSFEVEQERKAKEYAALMASFAQPPKAPEPARLRPEVKGGDWSWDRFDPALAPPTPRYVADW